MNVYNNVQSTKILLVPQNAKGLLVHTVNLFNFQLFDRNVGLFSIGFYIVIVLYIFCFIFGIISLLLCSIYLSIIIALPSPYFFLHLKATSISFPLLLAIALKNKKGRQLSLSR